MASGLIGAAPSSLQALRVDGAMRVDGRLEEEAWAKARPAEDFKVQWPDFGRPSAHRTEVRVLYDDHNLYVGARLHLAQGRGGVVERMHRRDQDTPTDWFGVFVDSLRDRRTAWAFWVNAGGVQRDGVHYADTSQDSSWDGVWESAVTLDDEGWTAELRIPLSLLRIREKEGPQTWGINFARTSQGDQRERSYWHLVPRGASAFVSQFPELTGMEGLRPQPRREWIPYASLQRKFETTEPYDDRRFKGRVGLDAHLGLGRSSQLDLTLRPDFGQVEVDKEVINLSTVETFFPEKRPFFLEGMDLFQFPESRLFYSRRLGRGLEAPELEPGEELLDRPTAVDILAAGKVTGRTDAGFSYGVLGAALEAGRARVRRLDGREETRELMPRATASVLRFQQALDDRGSAVGALGTFLRQSGPTGRRAEVGALDGVWRSADRGMTLETTLAGSRAGGAGQRVGGSRQFLRLDQQWRSGWGLEVGAVNASRDFQPNDLGYLERADERRIELEINQELDEGLGSLRQLRWEADLETAWDQAGRVLEREISASFRGTTPGYWGLFGEGSLRLPAYDDQELRTFRDPQKKYLRTRAVPWFMLGVDTAANRPYYLNLNVGQARLEGGRAREATLIQSLRLGRGLEIQLETVAERAEGDRKWVETPASGTPLTGLRTLSTFSQTLRVAYAFSPNLTLQVFSQWLGASWAFRDFRTWQNDDTLVPALPPAQSGGSERVWNLNLITRWEFRPGSTAYLVYSHGTSSDRLLNDRGAFSPRRDLLNLRHLPSDDTVQVKVSWLFR